MIKFTEGGMAEKSGYPRLIVGISGASGVILALETDLKPAVVRSRADVVHAIGDLAAPISSGSFKTIGMVVAPCSIRSMAEIATGVTTTLLSRAAAWFCWCAKRRCIPAICGR